MRCDWHCLTYVGTASRIACDPQRVVLKGKKNLNKKKICVLLHDYMRCDWHCLSSTEDYIKSKKKNMRSAIYEMRLAKQHRGLVSA